MSNELSKEERDMFIMGKLSCTGDGSTTQDWKERKRRKYAYYFINKSICKGFLPFFTKTVKFVMRYQDFLKSLCGCCKQSCLCSRIIVRYMPSTIIHSYTCIRNKYIWLGSLCISITKILVIGNVVTMTLKFSGNTWRKNISIDCILHDVQWQVVLEIPRLNWIIVDICWGRKIPRACLLAC